MFAFTGRRELRPVRAAKGIRLNEVTSEHFAADLEPVARVKSDFFMRPEVHAAHEIVHTTRLLDALAF